MELVMPCHVRFVLTGGNLSVRLVFEAFNIVASTMSEAKDRYALSKIIRKKTHMYRKNKKTLSNNGNSKCYKQVGRVYKTLI